MRPPLLAAVLLLCCAGSLCVPRARGDLGYTFSPNLEPRKKKWMRSLADSRRLFIDVTIPGTHNSGTYTRDGDLDHQCQRANVSTQLKAGVRFLDLSVMDLNGRVYITHGWPLKYHRCTLLSTVLYQVGSFLSENPSEVVIVRIRKTGSDSWAFTWQPERVAAVLSAFSDIIDTSCTSVSCSVGPSRGKIIFLRDGVNLPGLTLMDYNQILSLQQDHHSLGLLTDIFWKWERARDLLINASTTNQRNYGVINYFSAVGVAHPFTVASGQVFPVDGSKLWAGISKACWDPSWNVYPDFPRKGCAFCGKATVCSIHFRGTNNMLYDWLRNGRLGEPQSREVSYVWPRHLGILVLDFPDNAVLDEIIAVNFAQSNLWKGKERIDSVCIELPCASCIAGDLPIVTDARGVVAARDVVVGDRVPGVRGGEWCEVLTAVRTNDNGTVFGNFTADHLIVEERGGASSPSYVVRPNGDSAPARQADLVNIATTCPAARAASGELFTPVSTVFCTNVTWEQYVPLYGAIMRIAAKTGPFWFDTSLYVSAQGVDGALNSTGSSSSPPRDGRDRMSGMPAVCDAMLPCAVGGEKCDAFERLAAGWIRRHVPPAQYALVARAYPRLGDPSAPRGTLSADVRPPGG